MRWPWSKRIATDADRACTEAQVGLRQAQDRWPEVHRVATSLRDLREQNHFADALAATFRGER